MKSSIRYTAENITVYPIDRDKLEKSIDEFMQSNGDSVKYETRGDMALIKSPKLCIIDEEFVGHDVKDDITFYLWEKMLEMGKAYSCFPVKSITVSLDELEGFLKPSTTLAEFTKDRRGYNTRIRCNEGDWIRYFNK